MPGTATTKTKQRIRIKKPLPVYGGETLPAGTEITLTDEWETTPYNVRNRVILDPQGTKRLVQDDDLEYALGAHSDSSRFAHPKDKGKGGSGVTRSGSIDADLHRALHASAVHEGIRGIHPHWGDGEEEDEVEQEVEEQEEQTEEVEETSEIEGISGGEEEEET
jgi:hypothetical protein